MLCVLRWSDDGTAGRVRCWQVHTMPRAKKRPASGILLPMPEQDQCVAFTNQDPGRNKSAHVQET